MSKVPFSQAIHIQSITKTGPSYHFHVIYLFFLLYIHCHSISSPTPAGLLHKPYISSFFLPIYFPSFIQNFYLNIQIRLCHKLTLEFFSCPFALTIWNWGTLNTPFVPCHLFQLYSADSMPHTLAYFIDTYCCFLLLEISTTFIHLPYVYAIFKRLRNFQTLAWTSLS